MPKQGINQGRPRIKGKVIIDLFFHFSQHFDGFDFYDGDGSITPIRSAHRSSYYQICQPQIRPKHVIIYKGNKLEQPEHLHRFSIRICLPVANCNYGFDIFFLELQTYLWKTLWLHQNKCNRHFGMLLSYSARTPIFPSV